MPTPDSDTGRPKAGLRRYLRGPNRRLKTTNSGKLLLAIAIMVGFAALNTGNNLLFFGWGLLLSTIVISGIMSEATLRKLHVTHVPVESGRVGEASVVTVELVNASLRLPAFALELYTSVRSDAGPSRSLRAPFLLRLSAKQSAKLNIRWVPEQRGIYRVVGHDVMTSYPFGFFEKSRHLSAARLPRFWVHPRRVDVHEDASTLTSRLGDIPAGQPGPGDGFFSLRPYREGDDPRLIAWRRSARTGRYMTRETEAASSRSWVLELQFPPRAQGKEAICEYAIAYVASLAEHLLAQGQSVGIAVGDMWVPPSPGTGQRGAILDACAGVSIASQPMSFSCPAGVVRVGIVPPGFPRPPLATHQLAISFDEAVRDALGGAA